MFPKSSIRFEAAYIGEELLKEGKYSDLDRKCLTITQTVLDGDFSFEEALELYGVSLSDFESFFAKQVIDFINQFFSQSDSQKISKLVTIQLLQDIIREQISPIDKNSKSVILHLEDLSKQISDGKIRV